MKTVLIAEDEARIASFLEKGLKARGLTASVATTGDEALDLALSGEFDLLILDLGLPGRDGFEVLRGLREHDQHMPVIVLTARESVRDKVSALEGGADDYVTKPFRFAELLARIRAQLRDEKAPEQTVLRVGGAALDLIGRRVELDGQTHDLTAREFGLAELFFRHPGQILSRQQIFDRIWGYDFEPESTIVEVYVRYLRIKLGAEWITTVRGMGYRLEKPATSEVASET
jgi:DNA-binding response OmpR family regulator